MWSPSLATARRRATVIRATGLATLTEDDDPGEQRLRAAGRYLYEPDGAVIRAGLVTAVAAGVDGGLLDPHIAYVTSDAAFTTPFARSYEVLAELPFKERALRAALRERGIGQRDDQEARRQRRARGAAQAARAGRRRRGDPGDDPGRRRGHHAAGPPF